LLLSDEAKEAANVIYQTLSWVRDHYSFDQLDQLLEDAKAKINQSEHLEVEYLIAADASTLQILESAEPKPVVLCISVWANGVRLIDNIVIEREYSIG
jgi:pantothenate synthetase